MRIAVEAPSDFASKYDELLGPCALEFRVGGCFASLCCPQGGAVDIGPRMPLVVPCALVAIPVSHRSHSAEPSGVAP